MVCYDILVKYFGYYLLMDVERIGYYRSYCISDKSSAVSAFMRASDLASGYGLGAVKKFTAPKLNPLRPILWVNRD
jgi:hypothetical protein